MRFIVVVRTEFGLRLSIREIPYVTICDKTECVETIEVGWNRLVGGAPGRVVQAAEQYQNSGKAVFTPLLPKESF